MLNPIEDVLMGVLDQMLEQAREVAANTGKRMDLARHLHYLEMHTTVKNALECRRKMEQEEQERHAQR